MDGRDYYFLTEEEFDRRVAAGEFLEHVVYVSGHRYGTLRAEVDRILAAGRSCILELETEGAQGGRGRIRRRRSRSSSSAPTFAELERRLRERATESAGEIGERLALARRQMPRRPATSTTSSRTTTSSAPSRSWRRSSTGQLASSSAAGTASRAMMHPRIDDLLDERRDSRYGLVIAAAKRARQINNYHHQLGEGTFDDFPPPLSSPARRTT